MKIRRLRSLFKEHGFVSSRAVAVLCVLAFSLSALHAQVTQPWPSYYTTAGHCNGVRSADLALPNPLPAGQRLYIRLSVWNSGIAVSNSFVVERLVGGKWEPVSGADPAIALQNKLNNYSNYKDANISATVEWEHFHGDMDNATPPNPTFALDVTSMLAPGAQYRIRNKANVFHLGVATGTPPTIPTNFTYGPQNDIVPAGHKPPLQYLTPDGNWMPVPIVGGKPTITICKKGKLRLSASDTPGDLNDFFNYTWHPANKFEAPNNVGTVTIGDLTAPQNFTIQRKGVCSEEIKNDLQVNVVPKIDPIIDVAGLNGSLCGNNSKSVTIKELSGATKLSWGLKEDGHGNYSDQTGNTTLTLPPPPAPQEFPLPTPINFNYFSHDPSHIANGDPVEHEMRIIASNGECAGVKLLKVKVYPGVLKPNVVTTVAPTSLCSPLNVTYKDQNQALQPKGTIYSWVMGTAPVFSPTTSGAISPSTTAVNNTAVPQQFHSVVTVSDKSGTCKESAATYAIPALGITAPDYAHTMVNPGITPQFLVIRETLPPTLPPTPAGYCTPQKLRLEDKTPFAKWREWKLVEPAEGTLPQNIITWGPTPPALPTGTNPDFVEINPFTVSVKRKRYIEMKVSNGYCEAIKRSEIIAYPPPTSGALVRTPLGTNCWPYKFKLQLANIDNASSLEWRVDKNGGTGAANPQVGTFEIKAGVTTWEQVFEFSNATDAVANWSVIVTLHSKGDDCPIELKENVTLGARVKVLLENDDPIGCPDDNTGQRKVRIIDKSEAAPSAVRVWKLDGVVFTPTLVSGNVYEVTLQNSSSSATVHPEVSLEIDDGNGCSQTDKIQFTLFPRVDPDFTITYPDPNGVTQTFIPGSTLCPDIDGTLTATGAGVTRFEWTITNNGSTQEYHGEGTPYNYLFTNDTDQDLLYTVALKGINGNKCSYTVKKDYSIYPSIKAAFTVKKIDECTPYKIQLIDQTATKLSTYNKTWNVSGGTEDPVGSGIYVYNAPGPKVITLVASSPNCTSTSAPYNFVVLPPVVANIAGIAPAAEVCAPSELTFTNNSQNAVRNEWTFEVGTTSSVLQSGANIKYTYTNTGDTPRIVEVLLQSFNARNCKAEDRRLVTVYPEPRPINSFQITDKCNPFKLEFLSNSPSLSEYEWTFTPVGVGAASGAQVVKTGTQNGAPVEAILTNSSLHNFIKYEITYSGKKTWTPSVTCTAGPVKVDEVIVPPRLDVTIGVKPRPGGFNQELCSGETPVSFDIQSKGGAHVNHKWDFDDGGSTQTSYNEDPVDHQFDNKTQEDVTRHVKILSTQEETLCTFEQILDIVVHPEVVAIFTKVDGDICQTPREVTFTNSSRGNIGTGVTRNFKWDYGYMVSGIQQQETRNAVGVHNWHFPNDQPNTNAVRTVTLDIEEVYVSGKVCRSTVPATAQVVIAPKLRPQFTVDKAIACIPFTVLFTNTSTGAPLLNYTWDYADGNTSSVATATHTHDYNNISLSNRYDYAVSLTIENAETRCKETVTQTVTACPKVTADFTVDNTIFCTPGSVTVHNNSKNADLYQWNLIGGVGGTIPPTTSLVDVTIPLLNPTNADKPVKLQLIASATHPNNVVCDDTKEIDLILRPEIRPDFAFADPVGCSPMRVKITNQSTGARRYRWFIDGLERPDLQAQLNPEFDLINNAVDGTSRKFKVKLIAINGDCQGEVEKEVEVYPAITAKIILNKNSGCTPLTVEAKAAEQQPSYTYDWTAVQGTVATPTGESTSATFTNSTVSPAVVVPGRIRLKVYFTAAPQCKDETERQIDIYPAVYPDFIVPRPGCAPYDARFQLSTNVFNSPETEYTWSVEGKQVLKVKEAMPADPTIRLINNDNSLTITPEVKLHVKSAHGCEAEVAHNVTVYPKPKALFQANGKSEGCPPFDVEFLNQSKGVNLNYTYDFGDGSSISVSHNGPVQKQYNNTTSNNATYAVKLKAVSQYGCEDEQTSVITVYPAAYADFDILPNDKGCSPLNVRFVNKSNTPISKVFVWDFGDGTVPHEMNEPEHIFENLTVNDAVHTVTLLARTDHGCEATATKKVTVYATPKARIGITPMLQVFPNATVAIANLSTPAPSSWKYTWTFGDGQSSTMKDPVSHQYTRWGLKTNDFAYDLTLKVESPKCTSETTIKAYILPPYPDPAFTAYAYEGCVPFRLTLLRDKNLLHDDETYLWEFGDGETSTEKVPTHDYQNIGTYHVKLTVTGDGGVNYAFAVVTVLPNPKVKFTLYPDQVMLPKATVKGQNLTEGDNLSFLWNFGDGEFSTERSPIHDYMTAGKYTVKLEATNTMLADCKASDTLSVIVRPEGHLEFPNVFQPSDAGSNGGIYDENDRANEVFHPYGEGVSDYILRIYDRWGELIFESNDIKKGWDGYMNGHLCETGVYTWRALGHFFNGDVFDLRGNVTLLRK